MINVSDGERWTYGGPTSGMVGVPSSLKFNFTREYYVGIYSSSSVAGTTNPFSSWYAAGSIINLTAAANQGWQLEGWNGTGGGSYSGDSPTFTISVSGPIAQTAVFYPSLVLNAGSGGSIGYVYGSVHGLVSDGTSKVLFLPTGTSVTLTSSPAILQRFGGWSGTVNDGSQSATVTVNSPVEVTATFGLDVLLIASLGLLIILMLVVVILLLRRRGPHTTSPTVQPKTI